MVDALVFILKKQKTFINLIFSWTNIKEVNNNSKISYRKENEVTMM